MGIKSLPLWKLIDLCVSLLISLQQTMSLLSDLINLDLSDSTEKIIAEYIWSVPFQIFISPSFSPLVSPIFLVGFCVWGFKLPLLLLPLSGLLFPFLPFFNLFSCSLSLFVFPDRFWEMGWSWVVVLLEFRNFDLGESFLAISCVLFVSSNFGKWFEVEWLGFMGFFSLSLVHSARFLFFFNELLYWNPSSVIV